MNIKLLLYLPLLFGFTNASQPALAEAYQQDRVCCEQYDQTFDHSEINPILLNQTELIGDAKLEFIRIGANTEMVFLEVRITNDSDGLIDLPIERGYIVVNDTLRVRGNAFATQIVDEGDRSSVLMPGESRQIVVIYSAGYGQMHWNPNQIQSVDVHLFREGSSKIGLRLAPPS